MDLATFLNTLTDNPSAIDFEDTIAVVDANYQFNPTAFHNGELHNDAGENNGSCKILFFGILHELGESQTLACFGRYYRSDVLLNPKGEDHQNIRNFLRYGWDRVSFNGEALTPMH